MGNKILCALFAVVVVVGGLFAFGGIETTASHTVQNDSLPAGETYSGTVVSGEPSGEGSLTLEDGTTYEGHFKDGMLEGKANIKFKDAAVIVAEFRDNVVVGDAQVTDSNEDTFDGPWGKNGPHGEGEIKSPEGWGLKGDFDFGSVKSGTFTYQDGSKYTGEFKNGVAEGKGTYTDAKGWSYEGQFSKGLRQGEGTLTLADGQKISGNWDADEPK
ncbi:MAG: hypothetical protein LBN08_06080 [Lactobacillales bacterium]|jgi:hypothetical protein|nr:hypothetical protein [Lactobacillales bacterium]